METIECSQYVNEMWLKLGKSIEAAIPDHIIAGDPKTAMRWAAYAEACFWQATGENDTNELKPMLRDEP